MKTVSLLKLPLPADPTGALAQLKAGVPKASIWQARDLPLAYVYLGAASDCDSLADAWKQDGRVLELTLLGELAGASWPSDAPCHYVVETDVEPAAEQDLNAWYEQEHLPGLAAVPGAVRARRFKDPAGSPRYYACYDLMSFEVLTSPAWLAVRATDWSSRVRPMFRNTSRTLFRRA